MHRNKRHRTQERGQMPHRALPAPTALDTQRRPFFLACPGILL